MFLDNVIFHNYGGGRGANFSFRHKRLLKLHALHAYWLSVFLETLFIQYNTIFVEMTWLTWMIWMTEVTEWPKWPEWPEWPKWPEWLDERKLADDRPYGIFINIYFINNRMLQILHNKESPRGAASGMSRCHFWLRKQPQ